jgi:hypothetical protein
MWRHLRALQGCLPMCPSRPTITGAGIGRFVLRKLRRALCFGWSDLTWSVRLNIYKVSQIGRRRVRWRPSYPQSEEGIGFRVPVRGSEKGLSILQRASASDDEEGRAHPCPHACIARSIDGSSTQLHVLIDSAIQVTVEASCLQHHGIQARRSWYGPRPLSSTSR